MPITTPSSERPCYSKMEMDVPLFGLCESEKFDSYNRPPSGCR